MTSSSMTMKERVVAQINHRETDPVPYTLRFDGDVAERLDAHYGSDGWRCLLDSAIRRLNGPDLVDVEAGSTYHTDLFGTTWQVDHRPFHLVEPALKEPSLEGFEFPDVDAVFEQRWDREETVRAAEELSDHFLTIDFGFGLFERTWALRGFDGALMDAAANPAFYEDLVARVAEHQMAVVERLLDLPVDGILFSDDWGYQQGVLLGPDRWRRLLKPYLAPMYARVHEAGKFVLTHCCGSIADIIPDLIEIGLDVYQSVQPEPKGNDPYELERKYGDRMTFWGGLGSQSTIQFGTPDEIKAEVAKLCRVMAAGGGYILAPAKALQPGTPIENAAAVVEAFLAQAGVEMAA